MHSACAAQYRLDVRPASKTAVITVNNTVTALYVNQGWWYSNNGPKAEVPDSEVYSMCATCSCAIVQAPVSLSFLKHVGRAFRGGGWQVTLQLRKSELHTWLHPSLSRRELHTQSHEAAVPVQSPLLVSAGRFPQGSMSSRRWRVYSAG